MLSVFYFIHFPPATKVNLKRVIVESGSAFAFWSTREVSNLSLLFKLVGCNNGSLDKVECLRQLPPEKFIDLSLRPEIVDSGCCSKTPTVDSDFIIEHLLDIMFGNQSISSEARRFFRPWM